MNLKQAFKWKHYQGEMILLCFRWYLRYALSHRNLEEIMMERRLSVDHTTIYRWVMIYPSFMTMGSVQDKKHWISWQSHTLRGFDDK